VIANRTACRKTHYYVFLTLFILIASRPVNKNVSTGAVIRAKSGTEPGIHKVLMNYQTGCGYKFRPTDGSYTIRFFLVEFLNAPKLNPLKHDEQSLRCRSSQVFGCK